MQSQITIDRFLRHKKSCEYSLHAHEKLVMFFLASYMGKKATCYPSIPSLADNCSLSVDSIKRALKSLENKGLLMITRISGRNNQYAFNLNIIEQPNAVTTQRLQHPDSDSTPLPVQKALSPSAQSTSNNNSNNINKSTSIYSGENSVLPADYSKEKSISDLKEIFHYWQTVMNHPKAKLDEKRKQKIIKALKLYSKEELQKAIDGCANTPFNMGTNDTGRLYDDIELILRDSAHIERFIDNNNIKLSNGKNDNSSLPEFMEGII